MLISVRRRDPSHRMARFYTVTVQPALPLSDQPAVTVVREWGRIGSTGTVRTDSYPTRDEAVAAAEKLVAQKRRKGYK